MLEPKSEDMAAFAAARGTRQVASKCDHCAGYDDKACMTACPTGAMCEINPSEMFVQMMRNDPKGRGSFSPAPFLKGLRERGRRSWVPWLQSLIFAATVGIGLECFAEHTMPASSLLHKIYGLLGIEDTIQFASGRGLGHWLGYVGMGLMLTTYLYPLRSRLGWFKRISGQAWMAWHLWAGFVGGAFVTYHAMFKLDRWASISLWATWLLLISGVLGRYVYGWVRAGAGLKEFEKSSIEHERLRVRKGGGRGMTRMWETDNPSPGRRLSQKLLTGFLNMLVQDARDRFTLLRLRLVGLRHIKDRQLRRQALRLFADRARNRRTHQFFEYATRLLAAWNRVHMVLAIIMLVSAVAHIVTALMYSGV